MTRTLLLVAALWLLLYAFEVQSQSRAYTLAIGTINPTDQESQECVFPVGNAASLLLHPNGEPCVLVRGLIGQTGTLLFVPD